MMYIVYMPGGRTASNTLAMFCQKAAVIASTCDRQTWAEKRETETEGQREKGREREREGETERETQRETETETETETERPAVG